MDLIQSNGQPQYGRFNAVPTRIDYQLFHYKTQKGIELIGWRKRLKYKKFKFCSIQHQHYTIGIAIADLAWAGYGLIYVYDHESGEILEWQGTTLLARNTQLDEQPLFNHSEFQKSLFELTIDHANGVRYIRVTKYGEIKLSARIFCAGTDPLSTCSPIADNGWLYTQKLTTLGCEGYFINKQGQMIQFDAKSFASLDDTCGFFQPDTAWYWLSANFWSQDQHRVGINLAAGDYSNCENSIWLDGVLYPLNDVIFEKNQTQQWRVSSTDGHVDLTITPQWSRTEKVNFRFSGSQFQQWQSKISGYIRIQNRVIELNAEYALFEQHAPKL
jgi:hypothetical protein